MGSVGFHTAQILLGVSSVMLNNDRLGAGETSAREVNALAFQETITCQFGVTGFIFAEQTDQPNGTEQNVLLLGYVNNSTQQLDWTVRQYIDCIVLEQLKKS